MNFGQFSGHLPGFCPLLKTGFGHEKPRIYAGLRAFCPLSHFFSKTIMIKSFKIYSNWRKKSGFLTKTEKRGDFIAKSKVTWNDVFNGFKSLYPRLGDRVRDYRPYNYMSIVVYLDDGTTVVYDDIAKQARLIST